MPGCVVHSVGKTRHYHLVSLGEQAAIQDKRTYIQKPKKFLRRIGWRLELGHSAVAILGLQCGTSFARRFESAD